MSREITKKEELEGYSAILKDIKSLLEKAKLQAYKAVDNIRVQTYWQVGERIAREELTYKGRADYGENLISRLSKDLGFDNRLIYRMLQFYKVYPILSQVATELSWSHYVELIKIKGEAKGKSKMNKQAQLFYEYP